MTRTRTAMAYFVVLSLTVVAGIAVRQIVVRPKADLEETARKEQLEAFSKLVSLDFRTYEECWGGLPQPTCRDAFGRHCFGWRSVVLASFEAQFAPLTLSTPWYHPDNHAYASRQHWFFTHAGPYEPIPSVESLRPRVSLITGPGTAFDQHVAASLRDLPGYLILLIEVDGLDTHWMARGDVDINELPESLAEGTDGTGVVVGFADGEAWFLDRNVSLEALKKFFTIDGATRNEREEVLGPFRKLTYHIPPGFW